MSIRILMEDNPMATLAQSPRILREEADTIEACASGMGERKMLWAACEAASLRHLAAMIEIDSYSDAFYMTHRWSFGQRNRIPHPVFAWMNQEFPNYQRRQSQGINDV